MINKFCNKQLSIYFLLEREIKCPNILLKNNIKIMSITQTIAT